MSRDIQHAFLVWDSWYSEGDAKPDHGDVLPSFLRALCDEKFRFFAQAAFLTLTLRLDFSLFRGPHN